MKRINIGAPKFEYDGEDPEGFRAGIARLGKALGAEQTGISVYEVPPGQAICPYHYEFGEEEWLLVLEGTPTLRHPEGSDRLDLHPTGTYYPDSDKIGIWSGDPETDRLFRRDSGVEYYDGEWATPSSYVWPRSRMGMLGGQSIRSIHSASSPSSSASAFQNASTDEAPISSPARRESSPA